MSASSLVQEMVNDDVNTGGRLLSDKKEEKGGVDMIEIYALKHNIL